MFTVGSIVLVILQSEFKQGLQRLEVCGRYTHGSSVTMHLPACLANKRLINLKSCPHQNSSLFMSLPKLTDLKLFFYLHKDYKCVKTHEINGPSTKNSKHPIVLIEYSDLIEVYPRPALSIY